MEKQLKYIIKNTSNETEKIEAYKNLCKIYLNQNDELKLELWANRAFNFNKFNVDCIYLLTKYFRERNQFWKSMHYYFKGKGIDKNLDILFDYEFTIIYYYVSEDKTKGLSKSIEYLNTINGPNYNNVFENLEYYVQPLKYNEIYKYPFKNRGHYNPSSSSLAKINDQWILNVRYKTYFITPRGEYTSKEIIDGQVIVRTSNYFCFLDENFKEKSELIQMPDLLSDLRHNNTNIKGLEDLRIISWNNKIYYSSTSKHYSENYNIIFGEYDIENAEFKNNCILKSPYNKDCEKNWLPFVDFDNNLKVIYNWFPLSIGRICENNLIIEIEIKTPNYFKYLRGSSNVIKYNNEYWVLTHSVKYSNPRKYFHQIIVLDKNFNLIKYTLPFIFLQNTVEYCLSMELDQSNIIFIFSVFDDNPTLIKCNKDIFLFIKNI
jgi:hypothetical protein